MSLFHETLKYLLKDVDAFLKISLKDVMLNNTQNREREKLIDKLAQFLESHPQLVVKETSDEEPPKFSNEMAGMSIFGEVSEGNDSADICPPIAAIDLKPTIAGWLNKKRKPGVKAKLGPQKRWCCIKDGFFYYYIKDVANKPQGRFNLLGYQVFTKPVGKELHIDLVCNGKRTYEFETSESHLFDYWLQGLKKGIREAVSYSHDATDSIPFDDDIYEDVSNISDATSSSSTATNSSSSSGASGGNRTTVPLPELPEFDRIYDDVPEVPRIKEELTETGTNQTEDEDDDDYEDAVSILPPDQLYGDHTMEPPESVQLHKKPLLPPARMPNMVKAEFEKVIKSPNNRIPGTKAKTNIYHELYFSRWDFAGKRKDELSVKKGDIIKVVDKTFDKDSWWTGECNGATGLVPKTYLVPVYQEITG